jgi:hypothetical protein
MDIEEIERFADGTTGVRLVAVTGHVHTGTLSANEDGTFSLVPPANAPRPRKGPPRETQTFKPHLIEKISLL